MRRVLRILRPGAPRDEPARQGGQGHRQDDIKYRVAETSLTRCDRAPSRILPRRVSRSGSKLGQRIICPAAQKSCIALLRLHEPGVEAADAIKTCLKRQD